MYLCNLLTDDLMPLDVKTHKKRIGGGYDPGINFGVSRRFETPCGHIGAIFTNNIFGKTFTAILPLNPLFALPYPG